MQSTFFAGGVRRQSGQFSVQKCFCSPYTFWGEGVFLRPSDEREGLIFNYILCCARGRWLFVDFYAIMLYNILARLSCFWGKRRKTMQKSEKYEKKFE